MEVSLKKYSETELLILFSDIIEELNLRGVIRTRNNPVADYSEWLVSRALKLKLQPNSVKGFDAIDPKGIKYQIKGRRLHASNHSRQLSVIRNLEDKKFDFLLGVIFDNDFTLLEAYKIPHHLIGKYARKSEHVNGHLLILKGDILSVKGVERIDAQMRTEMGVP